MRKLALLFALALAALPLAAQPTLKNAQLKSARAAADLGAQVRAAGTTWVAYAVPSAISSGFVCCTDGSWRATTCRLDGGWQNFNIGGKDDDRDLTVETQLLVFYRLAGREIEKVRVFSTTCPIDAHGATVTWIDGVDPRQSVNLLASLVGNESDRSEKRALDALAMHAHESATDKLEAIARSSRPVELRGHATFWLGNLRGARGYEIVKRIANDKNESNKLREKAVFAMTQSKEPRRIDDLIAIARHDDSSHVRQQALFWLSQAAGKRAIAALRDAADNDPDEDVKKKAVFGISQLPDNESIPLLASLMRTHRNKEVRKQAAFWLGQKNDPRALAAIEDMLKP
jgi:HEAT repeat protein